MKATLAVAAAAFLATLALALPGVLAGRELLPDATEYVGIAWSWVSGAGLVDPVLYSFYLPDTRPPVPALAMRAPVVPVLLAAPLALGASLRGVLVLHALLAAALGASGTLLARRLGGAGAAAVFAVGFCVSFPWLFATQLPLTEAISVGLLIALAALAPRALASMPAAAGFGAIAAVAWLARPNLAVIVPAFALAAIATRGPREALRSVPLWTALAVFVALQQGVSLWCRAATGFAPYAHYGVLLETTSAGEAGFYQKHYVGWLAWATSHGEQVRSALAWNAREIARLLFTLPDYHYVGWLLPAACIDAWRRRDEHRFARLLLAATGLALLAVTAIGWGAIDPRRLLLPAALCFWLLAASWLAHLARRRRARWTIWTPALVVAAVWLLSPSAAGTSRLARKAWASYRSVGFRTGLEISFASGFCAAVDRDAIVASPDPWSVYLVCGNAGWVLPRDLDTSEVLARYLDDAAPGYLIVPAAEARRYEVSPRLERRSAERGHVLFALRDAPEKSRPWKAPPPVPMGGR